ncbi:alpha-1,2-fucosyltransferase [Mucilaginibacter dorajii]|uniref:Alpha-1,2-fucosyltransferase n=1 Tax=Mucilaginibacter dorajii TaxID=692994 RepID=A0ABP7Q312_9SPHI|nr:alpha-1,2-fucosyltransferase [Mucilaginibacter dorajii]MCS3732765.1 hypothetical protein [Mucilaginibacter dorajii]
MVAVTIDCRLGNQLFQYAFIKALSLKLDTPFFLNESVEKFIVEDYFELSGYRPWLNKYFRIYFKIRHSLLKSLQSVAIGQYNKEEYLTLTNDQIYQGYFQSEAFFNDIIVDISRYIKVKKRHIKIFNEKYSQVFSNRRVVAVHIRRGDYLDLNNWWAENLGSSDLTLPISYYQHCLAQIPDIAACQVIFVSDDIAFVKSAFAHIPGALFAGDDLITDFQLLLNADICILSQSTFSWWAAYLNPKSDKKIFCPRYWLGFKIKKEYPVAIIPPEWIQVEFSI